MRTLLATALLLSLLGCKPGEVLVQGTARLSWEESAGILRDGSMQIHDRIGDPYGDQEIIDSDGWFEAPAPAGQIIHAVVWRDAGDGQDLVPPTSHPGVSGLQKNFVVDEGTIWGFPQDELDAWHQAYEGCPGLGEGGAILGEVRLYLPTDQDLPLITNAWAAAVREDPTTGEGERTGACYLDPHGYYSESLVQTGALGRFALFGLEEGLYTLVVGYEPVQDTPVEYYTEVWVPDGGLVPRFPAWVELID